MQQEGEGRQKAGEAAGPAELEETECSTELFQDSALGTSG